ncbi:hypothetical protein [Streptomyces sp. NBC_00158]|uniref:hypothetical protein n=1 Tax=Streptomyces sp. NBC_00158 TaxID=2903627 RepID=UPI0032518D93
METPTALVIGQLTDYLRGLTQRLDPGAGWYGEFLRRDPEGMRACLDGVAVPPWDVLESLLGDLPGGAAGGAAGEAAYAAALRAAAVAAWDAVPGAAGELRTLLDATAAQRAGLDRALHTLTARLAGTGDPGEAAALNRELAWTRDDAARAAARHADLQSRLATLGPAAPSPGPGHQPGPGPQPWPLPPEPEREPGPHRGWQPVSQSSPGPESRPGPGRESGSQTGPQPQPQPQPGPGPERGPGSQAEAEALPAVPAQREGGRWLRGARRGGGARYAGAPQDAADAAVSAPGGALPPPGLPGEPAGAVPDLPVPPPRGARYLRPAVPETAPATPDEPSVWDAPAPEPAPEPARAAGPRGGFTAELLALRAQGRGGEAHALLCEAAAWPAAELPALAAELGRAGLAADWATLLWEAASLPPDRLAAAAAALGEAGREADCDGLLRQGVARPAAEVAEAALVLGAAGRDREAQALLGAFVRLRTAEEAAGLARRDPHWFAPRLLRAARALSATRHRDLAHALRVAGIPMA